MQPCIVDYKKHEQPVISSLLKEFIDRAKH